MWKYQLKQWHTQLRQVTSSGERREIMVPGTLRILLNQNDRVEAHLHLLQEDCVSGGPKMV
ncbi:MAG: hypothetical protein HOB58_09855 [Nitrospina sp.]|nr:hypothetical protein [Nitrospina sp.]